LQEKVKGVFTYLLEIAAIFALAIFLLRLAVCWLSQIWWILLILVVLAVAGWFGWRWYKNRNGDW